MTTTSKAYAIDVTESTTGIPWVALGIYGELNEEDAFDMANEVKTLCQEKQITKMLVDLTEKNLPMFSKEARYKIRNSTVKLPIQKVAIGGVKEGSAKMHALIAVRLLVPREANVKVFLEGNEDEALDWLEE